MKLTRMPYAQADVTRYDDGAVKLTSYVTDVAYIGADGWLEIYGLYSMATRKHISVFVKEYAPMIQSFATIRHLAQTRQAMNIYTGELRKLEV